jgi:hypothetical protein
VDEIVTTTQDNDNARDGHDPAGGLAAFVAMEVSRFC